MSPSARSPLLARAVPITVGLVLAFAGAACSSGDNDTGGSTPAPAAALAAAVARTTAAGSSRMAFTVATSAAGLPYVVEGGGAFDFARHTGRLHFTVPSQRNLRGRIDEIVTPATLYVRIGSYLPPGLYYGIDVADPANASLVARFGNTDPGLSLQVLRGAGSDVARVGDSVVQGRVVTQYRGTIDTALAKARLSGVARARLGATLSTVSEIPFDAFVDEQGRLRRVVEHLHVPATGKLGQPIDVVSTFDLYDFGTPVPAARVPESRVRPASGLRELLAGGGQ